MKSIVKIATRIVAMAIGMAVIVAGKPQQLFGQNIFPSSGNVGIGTTNPTVSLEVHPFGAIKLGSAYLSSGIIALGTNLLNLANTEWYNGTNWAGNGYAGALMQLSNQSVVFYRNNGQSGTSTIHTFSAIIDGNGNMGIGATAPAAKLDVRGGAVFSAENAAWGFDEITSQPNLRLGIIKKGGIGPVFASSLNSPIIFSQTNQASISTNVGGAILTERMRIDGNGNVGIGTSITGSYKLAVEGKIGAREVNVTTGAWADFVFKDDYKLRPLGEVEKFIEEHKHLPEVPSEEDVKANGVNLGETQALLLQKVEELTLYLIEQNKKLDVLAKESQTMKAENEAVKKESHGLKQRVIELESKEKK